MLGSLQADPTRLAEHLFYFLLSIPPQRHDRFANLNRNFDMRVKFGLRVGSALLDANPSNPAMLCADPSSSSILAAVDASPLDLIVAQSPKLIDWTVPLTPEMDPFARLPVEVCQLLLSFLPSVSLSRARLASRSIACISHVHQLPQSFWKSRFAASFEMGFYPPCVMITRGSVDWRTLYFAIKHALGSDAEEHHSLKNRRRIWKALEPVSVIMDRIVTTMPLELPQTTWDTIHTSSIPFLKEHDWRLTNIVSAETSVDDKEMVELGCRELHVQLMQWPARFACDYHIGLSLLSVYGSIHVSGIRLIIPDDHSRANERFEIGTISRSSEIKVKIGIADVLIGFVVAVSASGIVGLLPIFLNTPGRSSEWMRSMGQGKPDIAFGLLMPQRGGSICAVAGGFDVGRPSSSIQYLILIRFAGL